MSRETSIEIAASDPTETDVPLSERPLISIDQNTVISPDLESVPTVMAESTLSATAQEIRDRLFALPDVANTDEHGVRMGNIEVESRIGSGGMGAVFQAVDLELSRTIALKILHPTIAADPSLVARFRNEARACAELGHDNIARVFFAGEHDGVHYIAYEFAEGRTLKQLVDQQRVLSAEETVNYAIQATLALNHMHSAGIIHRDIKPSNIILTTAGRIKVVDLGLARRESTDSIGDLTVAGTTLGTFDYMAPEQARDPHAADIRSDIYSLGCTLYHMLTGQPPYPDGTAVQKMLDHQGKAPPDPRLITKDVPADLVAIVQKMMNTNPDERYLDPGQLLADLMDLAARMGLRSIPAEGIVWRRVPVTRVRELSGALFLTGAVVAVCLTALAMHFLPSRTERGGDTFEQFSRYLGVQPSSLPDVTVPLTTAETQTKTPGTGISTVGPATPNTPNSATDVTTVPEVPTVNVQKSPPFVVHHLDETEEAVTSLQKAWEKVQDGDVIELNFDGPLAAPTYRLGALSGAQQQITIRAAAGRSPMLVFEGDDRVDQPLFPGQLFYLTSNLKLAIFGVDFQVNVKETVQDDRWVLFECNGANRVELQNCTITVENAPRRDTSVFRLNDQTSLAYAGERTAISLRNVTIRGGCDLLLVDDQAGGDLNVENCAFAIDGSLVNNRGSDANVPTGELSIRLSHTTSILGLPAIRMTDSEFLDGGAVDRTLPRVDVISASSVYSSLDASGTLVDIKGNAERETLQDHLTWNGTHNLYHNFATFWVIESGSLDGDVRPYFFAEWIANWERSGSEESAGILQDDVWTNQETAPDTSLLSRLPKGVFALQRRFFYDTAEMPARHSLDSNGNIAGVDVLQLRLPPPTPSAVPVEEPTIAPIRPATESDEAPPLRIP